MQRKDEVIQKIFIVWPISNSGPPPHAVASCSSAWSRNRGQRPSAENPLRLSDRIPGV